MPLESSLSEGIPLSILIFSRSVVALCASLGRLPPWFPSFLLLYSFSSLRFGPWSFDQNLASLCLAFWQKWEFLEGTQWSSLHA
jgi:hypothetical protein